MLDSSVSAQDFSRQAARSDRFFADGILPADLAVLVDPTLGGVLKGQVGYSLSMGVTYDSNINLSATNEQDELYFNINPSMFYTSDPEGGARHVLTAFYSPNPQFFRDSNATGGSDSTFNHNGGVSYQFNGSRTSISAFLSLAQASGSDRFTGGYSEGTIFSYGLSASYQVAPRTRVYGSLSSAYSSYETAGQQGGDFVSGTLGAFWSATERFSIGPSLNMNWSDSVNTGKTTILGMSVNCQYLVTDLINLSGSVGLQGLEFSGAGDRELQPTLGLSFDYNVSPIWTWSGGISYANIPSPSTFGVNISDWSLNTSISRRLAIGSLGFNASYGLSDFQQVGAVVGPVIQESNYYSLGINYSRPFISDRISFSTSLSYQGSTGGNDWDKVIWTASWSTSF